MLRFIERLSYANRSPPITAAQARRLRLYAGAANQHRFVNRIARRQRSMRAQHRRRPTAGAGGTLPA